MLKFWLLLSQGLKAGGLVLTVNLLTIDLPGAAVPKPESDLFGVSRQPQVDQRGSVPLQLDLLASSPKQLGFGSQSEAQLRQANLYLQQGKFAEAEALYEQLIQQDAQDSSLYYKLGQARFGQKKYQLSIYAYQQAIRLQPNYALAYNALGLAYANQGRLEAAIAAFRQAIAINANYAEALSNLGRGLWQQGKTQEAIVVLEKARTLLERQQRFAEARQVEQLLLEIRSQPPELV